MMMVVLYDVLRCKVKLSMGDYDRITNNKSKGFDLMWLRNCIKWKELVTVRTRVIKKNLLTKLAKVRG